MFRQFLTSQTRLLIPTRSVANYPRFPLQANFSLQKKLSPKILSAFSSFYSSALSREAASLPPPPASQSTERLVFESQEEPKLSLTFTCTVPDCGHRSSHAFTKRAYTRGIVIVQCPGCKNRHLIADNLDWFKDTAGTGAGGKQNRNIEDIMREKGEHVQRGAIKEGGALEFWEN
ncbi:zf-DNL-domain-containing protein [Ceratobasidium sp. AG-I]|nr:zf-DNL-domain-containing protein [Ceratobasidium sp. AG-I]